MRHQLPSPTTSSGSWAPCNEIAQQHGQTVATGCVMREKLTCAARPPALKDRLDDLLTEKEELSSNLAAVCGACRD